MIRYAAHRVYLFQEEDLLRQQMVQLADGGEVTAVLPFSVEIHHTIWADGIILISLCPPVPPFPYECFDHYIQRMKSDAVISVQNKKLRAYQMIPFDIPAMKFLSHCTVRPLV